MTCRFCGQWNVASSLRCVFCGNDKASVTDHTVGGRTAGRKRPLPALPHPVDIGTLEALAGPARDLWRARLSDPMLRWAFVLIGGGLIAILIGLLWT